MSGLHRRLLDGSSRQLSVVVSSANVTDDAQLAASMANADTFSGPTNISNSTSSLASNPSPSMSIACHSAVHVPTTPAITTLASISSYPMIAPSSCIALRRPSANMFVRFTTYSQILICFSWKCATFAFMAHLPLLCLRSQIIDEFSSRSFILAILVNYSFSCSRIQLNFFSSWNQNPLNFHLQLNSVQFSFHSHEILLLLNLRSIFFTLRSSAHPV